MRFKWQELAIAAVVSGRLQKAVSARPPAGAVQSGKPTSKPAAWLRLLASLELRPTAVDLQPVVA